MKNSQQKNLSISTLALIAAMSTTLTLGGCGKKDKPKKAEIGQIEKVETRKVDNSEAEKALTALSLNKSGSGALSWASRDGDSGNYTFKGVTINGDDHDDVDIKIGEIELWGAHMDGEQASFDKVEFKDFNVKEEDSDGTFTVDRFALVKPSPALAAGIAGLLGGDEDAFDKIEGEISFKAVSFSKMDFSDEDEGNFKIDSMSMGEAKDKTGVFSLSGLNIDMQPEKGSDVPVKMALNKFEITGANLKKYKGLMQESLKGEEASEKAFADIMKTMNVYDPDFKTAVMQGLDVNAGGLMVKMDSYKANAIKKKGIVTMSQTMSPLSIIPPKDTKNKDMKEFTDMLSTMGYDRLEFTAGGTSIMDEKADNLKTNGSFIEMRDGFRLSYDMDLTGYNAFTKQVAALQADKNASQNPMAAMGLANAIQIGHIRLALRDDSIMDRYFKLAAEQENTTPDALKQKIKDSLGMVSMAAQDEAQQKLADQLTESLTSFLDGGGTFVFEMSPKEPVSPGGVAMGAMMGGALDIESLGISFSTQ